MVKRRLLATVGGEERSPVPFQPILSSADTTWEGFALEYHYIPPFIEYPGNIKFSGHLIALNLCKEPALLCYREQDSEERVARIPNGALSMCSSHEIVASRQYGASMVFPLLIDSSTMQRVCEETPAGSQVELIPAAAVEDQTLRNLILAMAEDLRAGCPAGRIFGESLANAIAAYASNKYSVSSCRFPEYRDGLPAACLRNVLEYIHANLDSDLGVAEIARVALISPYHFGKLFKRSTGHTLHQYVLEQRIRKAQSLLAVSNIGLAEIASMVGLANQSHFTTVFKKKMGVTPGCYRAQVRSTSGPP
jgi:AraC family transcriptional regulator